MIQNNPEFLYYSQIFQDKYMYMYSYRYNALNLY